MLFFDINAQGCNIVLMNCLLNDTRFILIFLFISCSVNAQVALPTFQGAHRAAKPAETPWGSNCGSPTGTNNTWNYMMGYKFTPQANGTVTKLGGYFNGTKTLRLWRVSSGELLASVSVSDPDNSWAYADITPVTVTSGVQYYVALYTNSNGGAYKSGRSYPTTYGNIRIDKCSYKQSYNSDTYPSSWSGEVTNYMYGMADITFVPD